MPAKGKYIAPIAYVGGKVKLAPKIIDMMPPHNIYVEPFVGSGAVYWSKDPQPMDVIADSDGFVTNFYRVIQQQQEKLTRLIMATPLSENELRKALHIKNATHAQAAAKKTIEDYFLLDTAHLDKAWLMKQQPAMYSSLWLAWAFWVVNVFSAFSLQKWTMRHCYQFNLEGELRDERNRVMPIKDRMLLHLHKRLENTTIINQPYDLTIKRFDTRKTMFYFDPPYPNTYQPYFETFSEEVYQKFLHRISKIKGKFILSGYDTDLEKKYIDEHGWYKYDPSVKAATQINKTKNKKSEMLITNYKVNGS